jgi:hypothetical protein
MKDQNRSIRLADFRTASPLHKQNKETPGEAPGVEVSLGLSQTRQHVVAIRLQLISLFA